MRTPRTHSPAGARRLSRSCPLLPRTLRLYTALVAREGAGDLRNSYGQAGLALPRCLLVPSPPHRFSEARVDRSSFIRQLGPGRRRCRIALDSAPVRAVPHQLPDPLLRAGVHPLVRQHGDLPDVLHEPRADGLLPGDVGRLPGGRAAADLINAVHPADARGGRPRRARSSGRYNDFSRVMIDVGGQQSPQQIFFGTERRREGPVAVRRPDRGDRRRLLRADRPDVRRARARRWAGGSTRSRTGSPPTRWTSWAAWPASPPSALASYFRTPPLRLVRGRAGARPRRSSRAGAGSRSCGLAGAARADRRWPTGPRTRRASRPRSSGRPITRSSTSRGTGRSTSTTSATRGCCRSTQAGPAYMLPHLLNRDAGGPPFEDVLIIGAGSGNDVAAALAQGAGHVDAVEIDPVINEIGRRDHPDRPYGDPRVTVHLDDGRSFVRKTDRDVRPDQSTRWSIRWSCTRAIRASGWRASCSPSRRSATSRRGSSPAASSRCTTSTARAGSSAGWRRWPRRSSARSRSSSRCPTRSGSRPTTTSGTRITLPARRQRRARRPSTAIRREVRGGPVLLGRNRPRINDADQRLRPDAAEPSAAGAGDWQQDRPGAGRDRAGSAGSRPTTGRSSTSASRRSPR